MRISLRCLVALGFALTFGQVSAQVEVQVEVQRGEKANPDFKFEKIPPPSTTDAGNVADMATVFSAFDRNSLPASALIDGNWARREDDPARCYFAWGRKTLLIFDLGSSKDVHQFNSYSWHPNERAPQWYRLWGSTGLLRNFTHRPNLDQELRLQGWQLIAEVNTRDQGPGGQVGVTISRSDGKLIGSYRYLLMEVERGSPSDDFGNTFYTEVDIIDGREYSPNPNLDLLMIEGGYTVLFDTTLAPELTGWVDEELKPTVDEWYPKILKLLDSKGYRPRRDLVISFTHGVGRAAVTNDYRISCDIGFFTQHTSGEAEGVIVHELVHVAQQYSTPVNPGWLANGVPEYIRWFLFEPDEVRPKVDFAKDSPYENSKAAGAFLAYLAKVHGEEMVRQLNAAIREGRYREET